jgi:membrane AbrB-like protein
VRRAAIWVGLALAVWAAAWALGRAGVPADQLFAALLIGLAAALAGFEAELPRLAFPVAQAVTGVVIGTYLHTSVLTALGTKWIPVILVSLATLGVTTVSGIALGRFTATDRVTASLGTVAGGASGIVAMAGDLGGDDRLVAFMQYLRVLLVVLLTPLLAGAAFGAHGGGGAGTPDAGLLTPAGGWLLVALAAPLGVLAGRAAHLAAPALLGPLSLAAIVSLTGLTHATPPTLLRDVAFAVIGLQIGLRFTRAQIRAAGRLLPAVLASIAFLVAACLGLGLLLSATAGVSKLDGYLATTPGGLYAVLPLAVGSGANSTFVLAVQALRVFIMILAAPAVVRWLMRRGRPHPRRST